MRNSLPLDSRTMLNEILSPSTLPSEILVSPVCPLVTVPVSLPLSTFSVNVASMVPFGVSIEAFQVPLASAANAAAAQISNVANRRFIGNLLSCHYNRKRLPMQAYV